MSIWDEDRFGVAVVVFCDKCGDEHDVDYIVPANVDSLDTARHHLKTHEGWAITAGLDLCPRCKPKPAPGDTETADDPASGPVPA